MTAYPSIHRLRLGRWSIPAGVHIWAGPHALHLWWDGQWPVAKYCRVDLMEQP